jgi:hypothetical protein
MGLTLNLRHQSPQQAKVFVFVHTPDSRAEPSRGHRSDTVTATLSLGYPRSHVPHHHYICPCLHHRARLMGRKVGSLAFCTCLPRLHESLRRSNPTSSLGMDNISPTLQPQCPETSARAQVRAPIEKGRTPADQCSGSICQMGQTSSERR